MKRSNSRRNFQPKYYQSIIGRVGYVLPIVKQSLSITFNHLFLLFNYLTWRRTGRPCKEFLLKIVLCTLTFGFYRSGSQTHEATFPFRVNILQCAMYIFVDETLHSFILSQYSGWINRSHSNHTVSLLP